MPQLIVPGIVRFAPHGIVLDRPWVNIIDVALGDSPAPHAGIITVANTIADTYFNSLRSSVASGFQFTGLKFMDLSTPLGEVGEIVDTPAAYSMPWTGTGVGLCATGNIAALMTKATTGGRSQRRGRCYIAGVPNGDVNGQVLSSTRLTALQAFATALLANVNGALSTSSMVVVHNPANGEPGATSVSGLTMASRVASQRRRLRA